MKIVFLQRDSFVKLGIEQLSAVVKQNGHDCELFIEAGERDLIKAVLNSGANLLAFSCTTGGEAWVYKKAAELKKESSTPIIVGGPHTTFFPEMIEDPNIDYICQGEGEQALFELLESMADNHDGIKSISNIWSKDLSGRTHKTEVRPLIEDLDELPPPDFSIYTKYKYMVPYNLDMFPVITGRGCPYNCSYCFNKPYRNLYRNKGKYVRKRSPDNVIQELIQAKEVYGIKKINFVDDSFFLFPKWLVEFSGPYKEKINLPFIINVEASNVKEDLVSIIKDMGCITVRMGVETGNDYLRKNVLNKIISNQQIREAAHFIKKYGIKLSTYNMLGLPGETIDNALETYQLNKEIGADFAQCSFMQPYPGTAIDEYVRGKGFLEDKNDEPNLHESFYVSSKIKLEKEKEVTNLQKLMQAFLQMNMPIWLVRKIIKLPQNPVFHLIFKLSFIYSKLRTQKMKIIPLIKLGLRSLSYMK